MRVFLAVVVSSISVLPLYFALLALSGDIDHRLLVPMLVAALAVTTAAVLFLALPLHLVLTRIGKQRFPYYAIIGFLVPALTTILVNPFGTEVLSWVKWQGLAMGFLGACVATIFWVIATSTPATGGEN